MSELEQYQRRCRTWAIECFGKHYALAQDERSFRFLEEALELVQASGLSYNDVMNSVDYVFNRAAGDCWTRGRWDNYHACVVVRVQRSEPSGRSVERN